MAVTLPTGVAMFPNVAAAFILTVWNLVMGSVTATILVCVYSFLSKSDLKYEFVAKIYK